MSFKIKIPMVLTVFIGNRSKQLRLQKGLTQEQFAEYAGFNYKFYQNIESARQKYMRIDTVERLAQAFEMPIWEFLTPPDENFLKSCKKRKVGKTGRPKLASKPPKE
ncbi:helix-turn-helix domain-containing protein [Intestinicryptomonas porci]|uniref:Helix-turn-helix domain-containing protein n=1 Tax=Intestinicryptomonas porci TaxID=2926320 RepID=A0ABU4WH84_9BACT|nr:helix-turn-helix domain-containing protein [Opitutales bacterium CLA-KB-P66]